MIAVIFEVWPHPDHRSDYFDLAAALKPQLEKIDGFISVERFESLTEKGKVLSLSFWRDEDSGRAMAQPGTAPRRASQGPRRHLRGLSPAHRKRGARLWNEGESGSAQKLARQAWIGACSLAASQSVTPALSRGPFAQSPVRMDDGSRLKAGMTWEMAAGKRA